VEDWKHLGLEATAEALLLARVDTPGDAGDAEARGVVACFASADALWATHSTDAAEAEALFEARRLAYPALERLGPVLTEDVCVPRSTVPEMLARIEAIGVANDVRITTIAHAGDGNLHPLLLTPVGDEPARARAEVAFEQLLDAAISLGGTVTGEHGVGLLKKGGMERELDAGALAQMRAVKGAIDPLGIFNPGKVL
jgi:glycolate oxidase